MRGAPKGFVSQTPNLAFDPSQGDPSIIWQVNNLETQQRALARKKMMNW